MGLERRHKVLIGTLATLLIVFMIVNSIFLYLIFVKQDSSDAALGRRIDALQADTQSKLNDLSSSVIATQNQLKTINSQIGTLDQTISSLKASTSSDFSGIIGDVIKSVVTIKTDVAQGSGFVIADNGYVVTNAHVMTGATSAVIITYDGVSHTVTKIGQEDDTMDIILLKINDTSYPPLELQNSSTIQIGEKVIAIGNPLGLSFSVSEGIVSAVDRQGSNGLYDYVQTDASLNPGNSGGPLIDVNGKVIGINNFKISGSENIGFALESNYIKSTVNNIFMKAYGSNLI